MKNGTEGQMDKKKDKKRTSQHFIILLFFVDDTTITYCQPNLFVIVANATLL